MFADLDLEQLLDDLPDAVLIVDERARIRHANAAVGPILGYERSELLDQPLSMLVPDSLRARHAAHHARFSDHPSPRPMGVGLQLHARHKDGSDVPVEIALVPVRKRPQMTAAFVRDVSLQRSLVARLVAKTDMVTSMTKGDPVDATMRLAAAHARSVLRADACWVALRDPVKELLTIVASDAGDHRSMLDMSFDARRSMVWSPSGPSVAVVDATSTESPFGEPASLGYGPLLVARIGHNELVGTVVLARDLGRRAFTVQDHDTARGLADVVAVALDLDRARAEAQKVVMSAEHERIARDLHDTVIQRLFAEGLRLESAALTSPEPIATHIQSVVTNLDEVIREIRDTIFRLQPRSPKGPLDDEVRALVAACTEPAGLRWHVDIRGDPRSAALSEVAEPALAVLRECLANTVRHASATQVDVLVEVLTEADGGALALTVVDDGVGPGPGAATDGRGLMNLQARAIALGGTFSIKPADGGGTVVHWQVPLVTQ